MSWLVDRLYESSEQERYKFALTGTLNWIAALAFILEESKPCAGAKLSALYTDVNRRSANEESDSLVYQNLFLAIHNLAALSSINSQISDRYDVVRIATIAWYYAIYFASTAMNLARSDSSAESHRKTAKIWHHNIVESHLSAPPFHLSLNTLVKADVETQIGILRDGNACTNNQSITTLQEAWGALYSYLHGTARYEKWRKEEETRRSPEFKQLGVKDFRTKAARALRDDRLQSGFVNFLVQAFRFRGKANYRDSLYLSYGADSTDRINRYTAHLEIVARAYFRMASEYSRRRVENGTWEEFVDDLSNKARITVDVSLLV